MRAFGLDTPRTLEDICDPARLALIVYDMQVGIVKQIANSQQITDRVVQVLEAARKAGVRVFFSHATCHYRRSSWVCLSSAWQWHGKG
jgi:biuret amidohydrolase